MTEKSVSRIGEVYERLTIRADAGKNARGIRCWLCQCHCGAFRIIARSDWNRHHCKSCGCQKRTPKTRHGKLDNKREYRIWIGVKGRCLNPNNTGFRRYGGRGITICKRWRYSFEYFISDMGDAPSRAYTLERKNNDGDYEPTNCIWAVRKVQSNNTSRTRKMTLEGQTKSVTEWCEKFGAARGMVYYRLNVGMPLETALKRPSQRPTGI